MSRLTLLLGLSLSSCVAVVAAMACGDNGTTPSPIPVLEAGILDAGTYMGIDTGVPPPDAGSDAGAEGGKTMDASADTGKGADAAHDASADGPLDAPREGSVDGSADGAHDGATDGSAADAAKG
jgi:hypothetical protein